MHLTWEECGQRSNLLACFTGWFFKTHTAFLGDEELNLPWYFGLCCWNYAVVGLTALYTRPPWVAKTRLPYTALALLLIFVQAPLSFMADYVHMSHDSAWHVWDRMLALPMVMLEVWRLVLLWRFDHHYLHRQRRPLMRLNRSNSSNSSGDDKICGETSSSSSSVVVISDFCLLSTLSLLLAVTAWFKSNHAQSQLDRDGFVFWHNLWHLYPIAVSLLTISDWFAHGQGGSIALKVKVLQQKNHVSEPTQWFM